LIAPHRLFCWKDFMLRTPLCDRLGIDVPILCAPMGFVTGPELAAAVSNAGGLGIMSFSRNPPEMLRQEIRRLRDLTKKPFGVNLLLPVGVEAHVAVCLEERVPLLSLFWGDPAPFVVPAHKAGVAVIHQVGSVAEAAQAAAAGVDIVIAQGVEAGGHVRGEISTLALVPSVVDAIAPTPVVAAGGIADARGVVAALVLGAQAVSIGTRFLATTESTAHPLYKQKIVEAREGDTVRSTLFGYTWPNAPHRTLRTAFVEQWLADQQRGNEGRPDEPVIGETRIAGERVAVKRFMGFTPSVETTGDIESMALYAGQGVGLIREIKPAAEVVQELAVGAQRILRDRGTH
jgi:NAD(P)H-dependent flavin oxidoreductase YrpB (nitropropane dioxygenase family)